MLQGPCYSVLGPQLVIGIYLRLESKIEWPRETSPKRRFPHTIHTKHHPPIDVRRTYWNSYYLLSCSLLIILTISITSRALLILVISFIGGFAH